MRHCHLIVSFLLSLTLTASGQNCDNGNARKFISGLFKTGQYISYDSTHFRDYGKELKPLKLPTLNKLLPDYCFYSTTFLSNHYEYFNVETTVAFSKKASLKSIIVHSPVFTKTPNDFIYLFSGLKTSDTAESIAVAKEIASIFASMTYKGRISRLRNLKDKNVISYELWHGDLSWRIYNFYFDADLKLSKIEIDKGVGRGEISPKYLRS